jgi:hypothetical protein
MILLLALEEAKPLKDANRLRVRDLSQTLNSPEAASNQFIELQLKKSRQSLAWQLQPKVPGTLVKQVRSNGTSLSGCLIIFPC